MKPIIILPPKAMSEEDIAELRKNDLCVVVAADPALVKFVDPLPAASCRTEIEHAAIQLSRRLLNGESVCSSYDHKTKFAAMFVEILTKGTPLDRGPTKEEIERSIFRAEKEAELRKLAREEAKKEREALKAKSANKQKTVVQQ